MERQTPARAIGSADASRIPRSRQADGAWQVVFDTGRPEG